MGLLPSFKSSSPLSAQACTLVALGAMCSVLQGWWGLTATMPITSKQAVWVGRRHQASVTICDSVDQ